MIQTLVTDECPACGRLDLVKNGHDYKGSPKYHCQACNSYGTLQAQRGYAQRTHTRVKQALLQRLNLRDIERIFGVSRPPVADWLAAWSHHQPPLADPLSEARRDVVLELDETGSFVLRKTNKRWIWVALCRGTRQIVASFIGDRSETRCLHLW